MSVEITREVQEISFTVERNGMTITTQPILIVSGDSEQWDGIADGGTP